MKKFLRNIILFVPLMALASCGGGDPKPDPYMPTQEDWTASIERINTGNMKASFQMKMGEAGTQTVIIQTTATKVKQEITISGITATNLVVKDGENYTSYYRTTFSQWAKEPSNEEEFKEMKKGLLPLTLDYSNFEWHRDGFAMKNKEPIVVAMDEETTTFTNVTVTVLNKQISRIQSNVTVMDGSESQSGTMDVVYDYKDADFDIEVPVVE